MITWDAVFPQDNRTVVLDWRFLEESRTFGKRRWRLRSAGGEDRVCKLHPARKHKAKLEVLHCCDSPNGVFYFWVGGLPRLLPPSPTTVVRISPRGSLLYNLAIIHLMHEQKKFWFLLLQGIRVFEVTQLESNVAAWLQLQFKKVRWSYRRCAETEAGHMAAFIPDTETSWVKVWLYAQLYLSLHLPPPGC